MVEINVGLTRKVAQLARLSLSDTEVQTFTEQLKEVLTYFEQLQEVDVSTVEPLHRPFDLATPLREDEVKITSEFDRKLLLSSAPELLNDGFKVPPVL